MLHSDSEISVYFINNKVVTMIYNLMKNMKFHWQWTVTLLVQRHGYLYFLGPGNLTLQISKIKYDLKKCSVIFTFYKEGIWGKVGWRKQTCSVQWYVHKAKLPKSSGV